MTNDIPPLNVKVTVDASGVQAGVAKASAGLEQISDRSKKMNATMGNLKTTLLGVFGGTLLTSGIFALGRELGAMKQETIDLQVSTERLNQALSGVGISSQQTQQDVFNVADSFYQLGFNGSEAVNAMGTLVTATGSVSQSTKLMAMSADLARYKHIDMNTAATILARGTQGSAKAFKELGITLDTSLPKNKAISKAFDELNTKIGGQATAYTKTFAGQMDILKERFDNIAQAIGAVVLPVLTRLVSGLSYAFNWISQNSTAIMIFIGILTTATLALKGFAIYQAIVAALNPFMLMAAGVIALMVLFVKLWNTFDWLRKGITDGISIILKYWGYMIGGIATVLRYMSYLPKMGFLKDVADQADKAAVSLGKAGDAVKDLANKKVKAPTIPKIPGVVKPGSATGITGGLGATGDIVPGGAGGGGAQTVQYITVYASNTNDIEKKMAMAAKVGVPVGSK